MSRASGSVLRSRPVREYGSVPVSHRASAGAADAASAAGAGGAGAGSTDGGDRASTSALKLADAADPARTAPSGGVVQAPFSVGVKVNRSLFCTPANGRKGGRGLPQDQIVATGSWGEETNQVALWALVCGDVEGGELSASSFDLQPLGDGCPHAGDVTGLELVQSAGKDHLVTTSSLGSASLLHVDRTYCINDVTPSSWRKIHTGSATGLAVDTSNQRVATVGEDSRVNLLGLAKGPPLWTGGDTDGAGYSAVVFQSSPVLVTAGASRLSQLRVWDTRVEGLLPQMQLRDPEPGALLHSVAQHPLRPPLVATGSSTGVVSVWDLKMPGRVLNSVRAHKGHVWDVAFHGVEPQYLFTAGEDGQVLMWDFNASRATEVSYDASAAVGDAGDNLTVGPLSTACMGVNSVSVHGKADMVMSANDNDGLTVHANLPIVPVRV